MGSLKSWGSLHQDLGNSMQWGWVGVGYVASRKGNKMPAEQATHTHTDTHP